MDNNNINIKLISRKGAALCDIDGVEFWIAPAAVSAAKEGRLTPAAEKSYNKAKASGSPTGDKVLCYVVAISAIVRETDKALLVADFNGNEAWLPKSAIVRDNGYEPGKSDKLTVKAWALRDKDLTHKEKGIWL